VVIVNEKTHWIVKAAAIYLWIMLLPYLMYLGHIPFRIPDVYLFLFLFSIIFIPLIFLSWIIWIPIRSKLLLYLTRLSPILLIAAIKDIGFRLAVLYGYFGSMGLFGPSKIINFSLAISLIFFVLLIVNAWYPIRSKKRK